MMNGQGFYNVGDLVIDRGFKRKGKVIALPKIIHPLSSVTVKWDTTGKETEISIPSIMLDPDWVEEQLISFGMWLPKPKDRVKVKSLGLKGTVSFVSTNAILFKGQYGIQIMMDKPYAPDSDHKVFRTDIKDLKKLKPKEPVIVVEEPDDDILWDDDELEWT